MLVARPIQKKDIDQIYELSSHAKAGLTTLPHDRNVLQERIQESYNSFKKRSNKPEGETYLFVLEDTEAKRIVGTSGIVSKVGGFEPFYTYEIKTAVKESKLLNVHKEIQYLQLLRIHNGPSEIGSLFLDPNSRHKGAGRLLSLCRFLFMAQYQHCFETDVIAELRGVFDQDEKSPFWETIGKNFFEVDFKKADLMVMKDKTFIEELMPEHPLYIPLLPHAVQKILGQVHENTKPALHMLEQEGFKKINEIDIFEAGPVLSAQVKQIRSVKSSREATVHSISRQAIESPDYLIANVADFEQFCVTIGHIRSEHGQAVLEKDVAKAIKVKKGSTVRYVSLKPE